MTFNIGNQTTSTSTSYRGKPLSKTGVEWKLGHQSLREQLSTPQSRTGCPGVRMVLGPMMYAAFWDVALLYCKHVRVQYKYLWPMPVHPRAMRRFQVFHTPTTHSYTFQPRDRFSSYDTNQDIPFRNYGKRQPRETDSKSLSLCEESTSCTGCCAENFEPP